MYSTTDLENLAIAWLDDTPIGRNVVVVDPLFDGHVHVPVLEAHDFVSHRNGSGPGPDGEQAGGLPVVRRIQVADVRWGHFDLDVVHHSGLRLVLCKVPEHSST